MNPTSFACLVPENVAWSSPWGAGWPELAILNGDVSKPGVYVARVRYPPNVFIRPHWHQAERHIVVLKGTWHVGEGETFDPSNAIPMPAGSYAKHPVGCVHWDGAKNEEVVLQVVGIGPLTTDLVWKDDPMFVSLE